MSLGEGIVRSFPQYFYDVIARVVPGYILAFSFTIAYYGPYTFKNKTIGIINYLKEIDNFHLYTIPFLSILIFSVIFAYIISVIVKGFFYIFSNWYYELIRYIIFTHYKDRLIYADYSTNEQQGNDSTNEQQIDNVMSTEIKDLLKYNNCITYFLFIASIILIILYLDLLNNKDWNYISLDYMIIFLIPTFPLIIFNLIIYFTVRKSEELKKLKEDLYPSKKCLKNYSEKRNSGDSSISSRLSKIKAEIFMKDILHVGLVLSAIIVCIRKFLNIGNPNHVVVVADNWMIFIFLSCAAGAFFANIRKIIFFTNFVTPNNRQINNDN